VKVSPPGDHPSYIDDDDDDHDHDDLSLQTSPPGMYENNPLAYKKNSSIYKENFNTQSHFVSSESLGNNAGAILVIFSSIFTTTKNLHNTLYLIIRF
jgi:hypothetical protein